MSRTFRRYVFGGATLALFLGGCTAVLGLDPKSLSDAGAADAAADAEYVGPRFRVFYTIVGTKGGLLTGNGYPAAHDTADIYCQIKAKNAQLDLPFGHTWVAWLSIPGKSMQDRLRKPAVPRYFVDRTTLVFAGSPLGAFPVHPINRNEAGQTLAAADGGAPLHAFTGTTAAGAVAPSHCEAWTRKDVGAFGTVGMSGSTGSDWTAADQAQPCDSYLALYCFEDEGTPLPLPTGF